MLKQGRSYIAAAECGEHAAAECGEHATAIRRELASLTEEVEFSDEPAGTEEEISGQMSPVIPLLN